MITISVVTITYNAAKVLKPTLDSVLAQQYGAIEHVIVDGASTDDAMLLVDDYRRLTAESGRFYRDLKTEDFTIEESQD